MGAPGTTPGRWAVTPGAQDEVCAVLEGGAVVTIAQINPLAEMNDETEFANAHQIAASGALYDALENARLVLIAIADSAVEAGFDQMADIIDEQLSAANNALAQARGETA